MNNFKRMEKKVKKFTAPLLYSKLNYQKILNYIKLPTNVLESHFPEVNRAFGFS
jgi:hypothetical protein